MEQPQPVAQLLPLPLPDNRADRIVLVMLRRMGGHGLHDAGAAMIAFNHFGMDFRRPLVLLRAFMADLAQASLQPIKLAPCCAMRMTMDEGLLLEALAMTRSNTARTVDNLRALTNGGRIGLPLSTAFALGAALEDMGMPLAG
jgi:hypothetical protein